MLILLCRTLVLVYFIPGSILSVQSIYSCIVNMYFQQSLIEKLFVDMGTLLNIIIITIIITFRLI